MITVFTNGCFDIIQAGHIDYLEESNLTNYLKATHFPKKPSPYYYDKNGNKKVISYE